MARKRENTATGACEVSNSSPSSGAGTSGMTVWSKDGPWRSAENAAIALPWTSPPWISRAEMKEVERPWRSTVTSISAAPVAGALRKWTLSERGGWEATWLIAFSISAAT